MLEEIRANFVEECEEDFVGLWNPIWITRLEHPSWPDEKVREEVLAMLAELLENKTVIAINPYEGQFLPLKSDARSIIKKIREKWDALGRDPNITEIVWFTSSDYRCPIDTENLDWDEWMEDD